MKKTALLLVLALLLTGCGPQAAVTGTEAVSAPAPEAVSTPAPTPEPIPTPAPAPTPTPDPAAERLAAMTVEEKVGQLILAGFEGPRAEGAAGLLEQYPLGGLILFQRNIQSARQLTELTNDLKELNQSEIPLFLAVDQEGGMVDRMPGEIRRTPSAGQVGSRRDPEAGERMGTALGAECAAFGLNLDFAPVLDVWSNPANTVIGERAFGREADTAAALGTAAAAAIAEQGVIPVGKHFPGHGDTAVDSHQGLPVVDKTLEELEKLELIPFRAAVEQGLPAVMAAHILMKELDPDLPASLSPAVVEGLLRQELGFEGVVFTDDLTMGAVTGSRTVGQAAVLAVKAGCDVVLACHGRETVEEVYTALLGAAEAGEISPRRLDESVARVLKLKEEFALSGEPVEGPDIEELNRLIREILK